MTIKTIEDLEGFCDETTKDWGKLNFKVGKNGMNPAMHFAQAWSADNAVTSFKEKSFQNSPWAALVPVAMAIAAPIFIFPAGLALTGIVGLPSTGIFFYKRKVQKDLKEDMALAEKQFPKMQEQLLEITDSAKALAREVNREAANSTITEIERLQALDDISESLEAFVEVNFGDRLGEIDSSMEDIPTAIKLSREALDEVEKCREVDVKDGQTGHGFDPSFDRDRGIDPNEFSNGDGGMSLGE